jgi:hypothetical protein
MLKIGPIGADDEVRRRLGTAYNCDESSRIRSHHPVSFRPSEFEEWSNAIMTDAPPNATRQTPDGADESHQAISQVIAKLSVGATYHDERREHTRYPVAAPVTVTPLSDDRACAGDPMSMMTLNISLGGAALIHKEPCEAPYAALNFGPAGVECAPIVMRILRRSRIGAMHVIAGEFVGG